MSEVVTLSLRAPLVRSVDASCITTDRFAAASATEIASLPLRMGPQRIALGELFEVTGQRTARVRVEGDLRHAHGIGSGMAVGEMIVDGDVGRDLGRGMRGGRLEALCAADEDAGVDMAGGALIIRGDAGDRVGAAAAGSARGMTGGEIVVQGSVGADAGARMRRGLLFVGGNAGPAAARAIIAGTVIVCGDVGTGPAVGGKRGTLVAGGSIDVPPTYRFACRYAPPHVRLALTHVSRHHGALVEARLVNGVYRRYCGDASTVGRGEILHWTTD